MSDQRPPSGVEQGRQAAGAFGGTGTRVILDQDGLDDLLASPQGEVGKAILRGVFQVERQAKQLAPVDTGRLRASITHAVERDAGGLVGVVGTNVSYAPHVELGTSRMSARAFLRGALSAVTRGMRQ